MLQAKRLGSHVDQLGESPVWDTRDASLHWIDVVGKRISICDRAGQSIRSCEVAEMPGCLALRESGGMVVAFRRRLVVFDALGKEQTEIVPESLNLDSERFNEGACDSRGRFWVGTMDRRVKEAVGALYRIDADPSTRRMADRLVLSNGIAWSPDDQLMYQCDSGPRVIYVYPFDASAGVIGERRIFASFGPGEGTPDGCAMDAEGFLWVAGLEAGAILRFSAGGKLVDRIPVPVHRPTSVAFGGNGLQTLFVTSMKPLDGPPEDADGSLFEIDVGVAGLPRHRFKG